jgi:hypothetical protein
MYLLAVIYVLTFIFNGRQEIWAPANAGWAPSWPTFRVASVVAGGPMDQAGVRAGDVLEAVDGQPLKGMPDWFVARAHFERNRLVDLQVRRGEQRLSMRLMIAAPSWRTWRRASYLGAVAFYLARFVLLSLALIIAFSRPEQVSARLAALMLAVGAVAEGYPSSGWAAALHHLPAVLAIPICVATASCLLAPMVWLAFFAGFPRPWLTPRWRWGLVLAPSVFFALSIVASAIEMIYSPSGLAKPWPAVLSAAPVRFTQDIAGVAPLLFLNLWPLFPPVTPTTLLEIWLVVTVLYFAAGFLMLTANYRRLSDRRERRRVGALWVALLLFAVIVAHNCLVRNWTGWFGTVPPALFSAASFAGEAVLFQLVPLALAYCVLAERGRACM